MIPEGGNRFPDKIMPAEKSLPRLGIGSKRALLRSLRLSCLAAGGVGRAGFDGADDADGALARARKTGPKLIAVTIDHGLRPQAKREAAAVAAPCAQARLSPSHFALDRHQAQDRLAGRPPATRATGCWPRRRAGRRHATSSPRIPSTTRPRPSDSHGRGSGLDRAGVDARVRTAGGAGVSRAAAARHPEVAADRDACRRRRFRYADDPSNRDPRFTRARLRG